ncbi:uncharacterized protein LOC144710534 isoform X3 [Wolffia australiana]
MWRKRKARTNSEFQHGASPNISSQLALDEAVAKALQYYENKLAAASPTQEPSMPDNGSSSSSSEDNSPISSPSDLVTQQDPDAMSYEELQSITEAVGSETRGLSDELISFLPSSIYKTELVSGDKHDGFDSVSLSLLSDV